MIKKLKLQRDEKVVLKLSRLVPNNQEDLLNVILRLLLNISFDSTVRSQIIKAGFLPKLVQLMSNLSVQIDQTYKSMHSNTCTSLISKVHVCKKSWTCI